MARLLHSVTYTRKNEITLKNSETSCAALSVNEAAAILGISRGLAYEGVRRGDIPSFRIGRRILVPRIPLERQLAVNQFAISFDKETPKGRPSAKETTSGPRS